MFEMTASTAVPASFLLRPLVAATLSTNSDLVIDPPCIPGTGSLDDGAKLTAAPDGVRADSAVFPQIARKRRRKNAKFRPISSGSLRLRTTLDGRNQAFGRLQESLRARIVGAQRARLAVRLADHH